MRSRPSHARGFTLIETVVASSIGAIVLVGCFAVFAASSRMDRAFNDRFERAADLNVAQLTMRRAMMALQMEENQSTRVTSQGENTEDLGPEPRDRMILELDPGTQADKSGWIPQRFEVVLATPPIAMNLAPVSAGWVRMLQTEDSLDFSSPDGSGGAMRSVFELRRTNEREGVMLQTGLIDSQMYESMTGEQPAFGERGSGADEPAEGWTLWWRPILRAEASALEYGAVPYADNQGTTEEIRTRLASAVPVARGIDRCRWQLFKGDEMIDLYSGKTMTDLPAYAVFELQMLSGQYATWMFEVDWVLGDDPNAGTDDSADPNNDGEDPGNGNGGPGNNNGNGNGNGRPGGQLDRPQNQNFNLDGRED
ncbi:MAG: prepilin-type N-terminal cleavage/methylation domain-containing protein [Phycisphaerales bacterium]|nr:prepilin-type N-terminal cleavage/methylation domain-containing protein [Phycisphaerales bacterium]